jgi:hypothetical protein
MHYTSDGDNVMGLNFKLDVGTLRLDQQVACQRYRQNIIDATTTSSSKMLTALKSFNSFKKFALPAPALV